jgi:hypothetical protein
MEPNILLMTLGTGAEGFVDIHTLGRSIPSTNKPRINLTVATYIYLLEPQRNPFVELQAMARAQHTGYTK